MVQSSQVRGKDVQHIWDKTTKREEKSRKAPPIYCVGQTAKISKENMKFAKVFEQN